MQILIGHNIYLDIIGTGLILSYMVCVTYLEARVDKVDIDSIYFLQKKTHELIESINNKI